jgi:hypothetical protein
VHTVSFAKRAGDFNAAEQRATHVPLRFTRARRGRNKKRSSASVSGTAAVIAFRPFQPSLRLHFTFPSAEPLTEACRWLTQLSQIILRWMGRTCLLVETN